MLKIISVFGTRPEAIKMAPLIKELDGNADITSKVCVTAQHRDMLDQVLNYFDIKPDYDLNIMSSRQTLSQITSRVLLGMDDVLEREKPDLVLVHGDTTTTFAAALSAYYHKVMVGHVEAGLRTHDKFFPYPEEMNRRLTAPLADMHFAPTASAKANLLNEGIAEGSIYVTGNTVIDALKWTVKEGHLFENQALNDVDYKSYRVITMTAHRRENWGKPLENICYAVLDIVQRYKDVLVVYPVHLNPAVRDVVFKILGSAERVMLLDPLSMVDMHNLIKRSYFVMTDSGGLQEEVPSLGKPVLVLRDVTERPEAVEAGTVRLVGTEKDVIVKNVMKLLDDQAEYARMANAINPYGDGYASKRIIQAIKYKFGLTAEKPEEFMPQV